MKKKQDLLFTPFKDSQFFEKRLKELTDAGLKTCVKCGGVLWLVDGVLKCGDCLTIVGDNDKL